MKVRNKKTGEIVILIGHIFNNYNSLAELNEEWEDAPEEPKTHWMIDTSVLEPVREIAGMPYEIDKEIGNWFDTKEKAELAVRKLKAWKRLKDKGIRFTLAPGVGSLDVIPGKFQIEINADMPAKWFCCDAVQEDLDTCFGGEE